MTTINRRLGALVAALLLTQACAQHANTTPTTGTQKAATVLKDLAAGLQSVQTTVISANSSGLIDTNTTATILRICGTVNTLGLQASALIRAQTTGAIPLGLLPLLQQIATDVNLDLQQGLAGIKDQKTLTTVEAIVTTIQAGLAAAVIAVGGQ